MHTETELRVSNPFKKFRSLLFYIFILGISIISLVLLVHHGESQFHIEAQAPSVMHEAPALNQTFHILIALVVVIATSQFMSFLFKFIHQPPVIGEIIGGIILGPSFLGTYFPEIFKFLLPSSSVSFLGTISQLGIILYMFFIGLEVDMGVFKKNLKSSFLISHASIVLPFLLGICFAFYIFRDFAPQGISFTSFSLFLGVSMSITAFPVLARILQEKNLQKTPLGIIALSSAAINDISAWCLLSIIVGLTKSSSNETYLTISLTILFIIFMFLIFMPLASRFTKLVEKHNAIKSGTLTIILVSILVSALATELIGIHAIFGAFLLGAIISHESKIATDLTSKLSDFIKVLFLPAFFTYTGMRTEIGLLNTFSAWKLCLIIIFIATLGKAGGTFLASKLSKNSTKDSLILSALMNTRGLVELIVLNVGYDLGIINQQLFTMLVIMAVVTTFITSPLLDLINRKAL